MVQLSLEFQFNAAHRLPHYEGPCFHTHGHNYRLLVLVEGKVDPQTGLSVDFEMIKKRVREHVLHTIDHNDLNRVLDNPTAENVITWIWRRLQPALPGLVELQLYETADCGVIYRGESHEQAAASGS
ncbi:MAG: 6-carboxytetrahydropterin synthase QueD [Acidobacteriota bacterium]